MKIKTIFFFFQFILFLGLSFSRLGSQNLWHDEAEIATVAKNVVTSGLPTVMYNGDNLLPIARNPYFFSDKQPHLFKLQTWLTFYIAALSMIMFGQTLLGVRLFFWLLGCISLYVFYRLTKMITRNNTVSYVAVSLLMFSTQYLILIRQARYYSPVILLSSLCIYFFLKSYKDEFNISLRNSFIFTVCMILLFHTHYLSFFGLFMGFVLFYFFEAFRYFKQYSINKLLKSYLPVRLLLISFLLTFTLPWLIAMREKLPTESYTISDFFEVPAKILVLITRLNRQIPLIAVIFGIVILIKHLQHMSISIRKHFFTLFFVIIGTYITVAIGSALNLQPSINAEFRYTLAVFPYFFVFMAYALSRIFQYRKWIGIGISMIVLSTNLLSLPLEIVLAESYWPFAYSKNSVRSYLFEYLHYELNLGYTGPVDAIVSYLGPRLQAEDELFVSSEGISLLFRFPGVKIDNEYTYEFLNNKPIAPENLLKYKWLIFRQVCAMKCVFGDRTDEFKAVIDRSFIHIELPVHDYIVQNREEVPYHLFRSPLDYPHVSIYERKFDLKNSSI